VTLLGPFLATAAVGCGSSGSKAPAQPTTPNASARAQISGAFGDVGLACLSPSVDETKLDNDVNTLIDSFTRYGDATFSIGGPKLSMRSVLERSRDQLRNCAASGRAPNAGSLADMIDHTLEK
jgi:hypothetical protein